MSIFLLFVFFALLHEAQRVCEVEANTPSIGQASDGVIDLDVPLATSVGHLNYQKQEC
jgi:hypothetical protein